MAEEILQTEFLGKICKYHKRLGQTFTRKQIIKGFCPHAFYSVYPFCLSLLYGAKFPDKKIIISCQKNDGIKFSVEKVRKWNFFWGFFLKALKYLSEKFWQPLDIEDGDIKIEKVSFSPNCSFVQKKPYFFNIRRLNELCPASFYQLYPFLLSNQKGWEINCPDHEGMVYRLKDK